MTRILVIANQTLGGRELERAVVERIESGVREVIVVVPETAAADLVCVDQYGIQLPCADIDVPSGENEAHALAEDRLEALLAIVRSHGVGATGVLGDADPWLLFSRLDPDQFDEVIVSTLDPPLSRWLRMDLVSRIDRSFDGPVYRVSAGSAQPA